MLLVAAGAATAVVLAPPAGRADYLTQSVDLHSQLGGPHAGVVLVEGNSGTGAAVNGLLPGQVRLTFTANPEPAYIKNGTNFGLDNVTFNTDLSITPSQIAVPNAWSALHYNDAFWTVQAPNEDARNPKVALLFSGLGNQATPNHFLITTQIGLPESESLPPFIFGAGVAYQNSGFPPTLTDSLVGDTLQTPEPSGLITGTAAAVALAIVGRGRARLREWQKALCPVPR
jgi:hypothetical protein